LPVGEVVIDTNVLLDWLVFRDSPVARLAWAIEEGRWRWIATPAMLTELGRVVDRNNWQSDHVLTSIAACSHQVTAPCPRDDRAVLRCRDPDDQMFVDLAIERRVRCLVTRDKALLRLARAAAVFGVQVCRPADIDWLHDEERAA
jgi:putative PIN family toxin of toxin-antitoxin system